MRHLEILAKAEHRAAATLYPTLCDFARYPEHCEAVRSVSVTPLPDGSVESRWEVTFHRGILRWTEQDRFQPETHTISFAQVEGDVDHFSGEWTLQDTDDGCLIRFAARVDLGLPGLADLLEPIAEQALATNIRSILRGLLGEPLEFLPTCTAGAATITARQAREASPWNS
jgi:ribosome-associated toxin RatA of RatAB toxin-antitoxin module